MKKTTGYNGIKSLLCVAVTAAAAGVCAAPAFADSTPQEFHAKVNISTDNTCSLTITPAATTTYNNVLTIDTGTQSATITGTPTNNPQDLTTVAYSTGCTFSKMLVTVKHTGPDGGKWHPTTSNPSYMGNAFAVPTAGGGNLPMAAELTAIHVYNGTTDVSAQYTATPKGDASDTLTTEDKALGAEIKYPYGGILNGTCGDTDSCNGYWASNRTNSRDTFGVTLGAWLGGDYHQKIETTSTDAASQGTSVKVGFAVVAAAKPLSDDATVVDFNAIADGTDISDTYTMEFSIA